MTTHQNLSKEHGNEYRARSCLDIWGLADWIYCVSGQVEHLQGHKWYLKFSLLRRHPGQGQLLGPRKLFQQRKDMMLELLKSFWGSEMNSHHAESSRGEAPEESLTSTLKNTVPSISCYVK